MRSLIFLQTTVAISLITGVAECRSCCCNSNVDVPSTTWDYIIIGDGTAGAVLARELSNNRDNSVLVLEWGQNRTDDPAVLSPDVFAFTDVLTYDPRYAVNQIVPLNFPSLPEQYFIYSDGVMWGGSSAHNGLFAVRGTPTLYNSWAAMSGNPAWSYNNLLPLILNMEHYTPDGTVADPMQRGLSGPLFITQTPPVNMQPLAIAESMATGAPLITDYNNPSLGDTGVSAHQQWITPDPDSHRSFSSNAYMNVGDIVDAKGFGLDGRQLFVQSNALVSKVLFKSKTAIGVEYTANGSIPSVMKAFARKKVILCAGAIGTTCILERSGIGDKALLNSLGIPVVVDNPNVGEHLINHYGVGGVITGSTTIAPFLDAYIDERPYMPADSVRRVQVISLNVNGVGIAISGTLLHPGSRGSVHIVDKDPTIRPALDLNMFSDGSVTTPGTDAYMAVSFYKILQTIASDLGETVISPPASVYMAGDNALLTYGETLPNLSVAYHAVGTARMGQSINDSVVDGKLHVFGVKNLMVADVSIEPQIQDGNTAYAAYLIGQVAASIIAEEDASCSFWTCPLH